MPLAHDPKAGITTITRRTWSGNTRAEKADELIPAGRIVTVSFSFVMPNAATLGDVKDWLGLELGYGSMSDDNPLGHHDLTASRSPEVVDTGLNTDALDLEREALEMAVKRMKP